MEKASEEDSTKGMFSYETIARLPRLDERVNDFASSARKLFS